MDQNTKKFILVAEDDAFYANIYRVKLTNIGYDVTVVGNGEEALKVAKERRPDLILLDLIMPSKDGFQTLKELRSDHTYDSVKIVILSSLSQDEDNKKAMEYGANDYVVKTNISLADMLSKIEKYLS